MVVIDQGKCISCSLCFYACPVSAISLNELKKAVVDGSVCIECGVCTRICPVKAINITVPPYPYVFKLMSNPTLTKETGIPGRGTDEVKTNDVTGRYRKGEVGLAIDVGRPNVTTTLADIVKILIALESAGVELEKENPQIKILEDLKSGKLSYEDLSKVRLMSMVLEGKTKIENLPKVIDLLKVIEKEVDTVFSIGVICRVNEDYTIPCYEILKELGIEVMPFAKINLGLGRPLITD